MTKQSQPDERQMITGMVRDLSAAGDAADATDGTRAIAGIMAAAHFCRRANMPPQVAAALIVEYILRGDPI